MSGQKGVGRESMAVQSGRDQVICVAVDGDCGLEHRNTVLPTKTACCVAGMAQLHARCGGLKGVAVLRGKAGCAAGDPLPHHNRNDHQKRGGGGLMTRKERIENKYEEYAQVSKSMGLTPLSIEEYVQEVGKIYGYQGEGPLQPIKKALI